MANSQW